MVLLRSRPNKLIYPGGQPGFNPAHPAARSGRVMAGVAVATANAVTGSGNLISSITGVPFVITTANQSALDGHLGPCFDAANSSGQPHSANTVGDATSFASGIFAGIIKMTTTMSNGAYGTVAALGGTHGLWIQGVGGNNIVDFFYSADSTGPTLITGVPYFVAASHDRNNPSAQTLYIVAKNLLTGQLQVVISGPQAGGSGFLAFNLPLFCGIDSAAEQLKGIQAAGMAAVGSLTLPELLAWADDPWSFWYPNQIDLARSIQTAPSLAAGLAPVLLPPWADVGIGPRAKQFNLLNAGLPSQPITVTTNAGTLPFMGVG